MAGCARGRGERWGKAVPSRCQRNANKGVSLMASGCRKFWRAGPHTHGTGDGRTDGRLARAFDSEPAPPSPPTAAGRATCRPIRHRQHHHCTKIRKQLNRPAHTLVPRRKIQCTLGNGIHRTRPEHPSAAIERHLPPPYPGRSGRQAAWRPTDSTPPPRRVDANGRGFLQGPDATGLR